jgi:hypothetical protein
VRAGEGFIDLLGAALMDRIHRAAPGVQLRFTSKPDWAAQPLREGAINLKIGTVSLRSRPLMLWLTKGWLTPNMFAAAVKPPASTTASKTRISSKLSSFMCRTPVQQWALQLTRIGIDPFRACLLRSFRNVALHNGRLCCQAAVAVMANVRQLVARPLPHASG